MNTMLGKSAATAALLAAIAIEANHSFIQREPWNGFTLSANYFSYGFVGLWALSIAAIWIRSAIAKPAILFGLLFLLAHGMVLSLAGNQLGFGIPYIALSIFAGVMAVYGEMPSRARAATHSERERLGLAA